tara:strand:- start:86 stop:493 length:408 start_codon:yes stop_codon:yes gene_type:complete
MCIIPIVARYAPRRCINALEYAFHAAGLETNLFVFGESSAANDAVIASLAETTSTNSAAAVWLVPKAFIEIDSLHRHRAALARSLSGLPAGLPRKRVYVVYDDAGPFPNEFVDTYSLQAILEGTVPLEYLLRPRS